MELSPAQKHLIKWLRYYGIEKDAIVGIVASLEKPEQLDKMMEWMSEHRELTTQEALRKLVEILGPYKP